MLGSWPTSFCASSSLRNPNRFGHRHRANPLETIIYCTNANPGQVVLSKTRHWWPVSVPLFWNEAAVVSAARPASAALHGMVIATAESTASEFMSCLSQAFSQRCSILQRGTALLCVQICPTARGVCHRPSPAQPCPREPPPTA